MKAVNPRVILPVLLAAALPAVAALAQSAQPPSAARARLSADAVARLQDGRFAMIREALKLNDQQMKLWTPVETQMRAAAALRQKAREERMMRRQDAASAATSLPDRLDHASQRMAERAAQAKAFAEVFRPFYASLSEDQKAVAGLVLRDARGGSGRHHRWAHHWAHHWAHNWAMERAPGTAQ
jgi:hypothetical protein